MILNEVTVDTFVKSIYDKGKSSCKPIEQPSKAANLAAKPLTCYKLSNILSLNYRLLIKNGSKRLCDKKNCTKY